MATVAKNIPSDEMEIMREMRINGASYLEISLKLRRSTDTVSYWCRSMGLIGIKRKAAMADKEDFRNLVADLFEKGASIRAIAQHIGICVDTARSIAQQMSLVRSRSRTGPAPGTMPVLKCDDASQHGNISIPDSLSPERIEYYRSQYGNRVIVTPPVYAELAGDKFFIGAA